LRAELIFTGSELLLGQVVNSYADYLSRRLRVLGIEVVRQTTVGDHRERITAVLESALAVPGLVIITGGLGPTGDDLTREAVAGLLDLELVFDTGSYQRIREFYGSRGEDVPASVQREAFLPAGARALPNPCGTAPGIVLKRDGSTLIMLPGPPQEMKAIFEESVEALLAGLAGGNRIIRSRLVKFYGLSESDVLEHLKDLEGPGKAAIAYTARPGEVHVRVTGTGTDEESALRLVEPVLQRAREQLAEFIYGYDEDTPELGAGSLLAASGLTLALAESCTGGMIAARITSVPGSSDYFLGGVVAYDNRVKQGLLGVSGQTLELKGAVSSETAREMALGACRALRADLGLSVTGIAGPGGGTPQKPVGLVHFALARGAGVVAGREFIFPGLRQAVRNGAAICALQLLRSYLENLKKE
jgi:nicotinamide-nucleotide amidase